MCIYSYCNVFKSKELNDKQGSPNLVVYLFEANKNYCKTNKKKYLIIKIHENCG